MDFALNITSGPEIRNALGGLSRIGGDRALYVETEDGFTPVATITRYPGCPEDTFEKVMELLENGRERG